MSSSTRPSFKSATGEAGKEQDLAVGAGLFEPGALIDLAVDGDGDALIDERLQLRIVIAQALQQLADLACLHLELRTAAAGVLQAAA